MNEVPGQKKADRVLLVDDTLDNLQVLYQALEEEGYELLLAQSGDEALVTARETNPALILLDINMPGLDGYETCRQLKADPETSRSVIVFLSARGALNDKLEGFECGAVDYIEKPFQFEEVVARVRAHLATYHRERELEQIAEEQAPQELTPGRVESVMAEGEGERVEFKSTLRCNLHTGKSDKRMENSCLKTIAGYLNAEGGILLVGVNDEGEAVGLEADKFPNNDKLLLHATTLIRNHLGGEFAPFVHTSIHSIDDHDVLAIECLPSPQPVYFRRDGEEKFYLRLGPSTQALSPSEIVAYVSNRSE